MQKKTLVLFLSSFTLQFLSAGEPFMFVKRVENNIDRCNLENILPDGSVEVLYNLGSKSDLERLFFDRFNAPVEFFFRPNPGMNDPRDVAGLRILKDTADNSYRLEVKRIANLKEVDDELDKEYPYVYFRAEDVTPELPYSEIRRHIEHNDSMDTKRRQERMKRYRVETKSFRISQQLADALYRSDNRHDRAFRQSVRRALCGLFGHVPLRSRKRGLDSLFPRCAAGRDARAFRSVHADASRRQDGRLGRGGISESVEPLNRRFPGSGEAAARSRFAFRFSPKICDLCRKPFR